MAREHKKIVMPYVILCEGIDTENFLISYLNSSELEYDKKFSETIHEISPDLNITLPTLMLCFFFDISDITAPPQI